MKKILVTASLLATLGLVVGCERGQSSDEMVDKNSNSSVPSMNNMKDDKSNNDDSNKQAEKANGEKKAGMTDEEKPADEAKPAEDESKSVSSGLKDTTEKIKGSDGDSKQGIQDLMNKSE